MPTLTLRLFGPPMIHLDNAPVYLSRRRAMALLAYLAVTRQSHSREALATLFCPEQGPEQAHAELRRVLTTLRAGLGAGQLATDYERVGLNWKTNLWVDVNAFRQRLADWRSHHHGPEAGCPDCLAGVSEAVDLFKADFLLGFSLKGNAAFEDWLFFEREELKRELSAALDWLVDTHSHRGKWELAIDYARRRVALDPLDEAAHCQLMRLYTWSGQRSTALRQYRECQRVLREELGMDPQAQTVAVYQEILAIWDTNPSEDRGAAPLPNWTPVAPHNLPVQMLPFVGRETLLAEVSGRLMDPTCRLVSLVGPGGCGKTRLALEAAALHLREYPDGVFFVPLASVESLDALVPTIASAIGFSDHGLSHPTNRGAFPRQQLLSYLSEKRMLVVLDNCEHLLAGMELASAILEAAPKVKLLATSRARLNLLGEHLLPVAGLDLPELGEELRSGEQPSAVRFFVQCARLTQAGFRLSADSLADVVRICRLVDGLPLGILLAAGWLETLSPGEVAGRIENSLDFLESELQDLPERQRSLRAVFEHSFRLLNPPEQRALAGLSVFRGGFLAEAAEQVLGVSLNGLTALAGKSLLQRRAGGRFFCHEMLRQYAAERLSEVPEEEKAVRDHHAGYYAGFLRLRQKRAFVSNEPAVLGEISAEMDNLRSAWEWAVSCAQLEIIDSLQLPLANLFLLRGWYTEGAERFARAEQHLREVPPIWMGRPEEVYARLVHARVSVRLAWFWSRVGLIEKSRELFAAARTVFRDQGDRREEALAFINAVHWQQWPYEQIREEMNQACAVFEAYGDIYNKANGLSELAWIAMVVGGDFVEARRLVEESLAMFRELGNLRMVGAVLFEFGMITLASGEYAHGETLLLESLELSRKMDMPSASADALCFLGLYAAAQRNHARARQLITESIAIYRRLGSTHYQAECYTHLSEIESAQGNYAEALQLAEQSRTLYRQGDPHLIYSGWCLIALGEALTGLRDFTGARRNFCQALIRTRTSATLSGTVLGAVAQFFSKSGRPEKALELASFVAAWRGSIRSEKEKAEALVSELKAELPAEIAAAALARGQRREMQGTMDELINELSGETDPS